MGFPGRPDHKCGVSLVDRSRASRRRLQLQVSVSFSVKPRLAKLTRARKVNRRGHMVYLQGYKTSVNSFVPKKNSGHNPSVTLKRYIQIGKELTVTYHQLFRFRPAPAGPAHTNRSAHLAGLPAALRSSCPGPAGRATLLAFRHAPPGSSIQMLFLERSLVSNPANDPIERTLFTMRPHRALLLLL